MDDCDVYMSVCWYWSDLDLIFMFISQLSFVSLVYFSNTMFNRSTVFGVWNDFRYGAHICLVGFVWPWAHFQGSMVDVNSYQVFFGSLLKAHCGFKMKNCNTSSIPLLYVCFFALHVLILCHWRIPPYPLFVYYFWIMFYSAKHFVHLVK